MFGHTSAPHLGSTPRLHTFNFYTIPPTGPSSIPSNYPRYFLAADLTPELLIQFEASVKRLDLMGTTEASSPEDKSRIVSEVGVARRIL
jgi:hypothetical protein